MNAYPWMSLCLRIAHYMTLRYSWMFLGLCSTAQQVFIYTLYHVFETCISLCYCMVHMNH